jgi:hypothetical protein
MADHPSGKPLYVLSFGMTARGSVSSPIPADGPELFATLFQHSAELENFQTAFRLFAGSASNALGLALLIAIQTWWASFGLRMHIKWTFVMFIVTVHGTPFTFNFFIFAVIKPTSKLS